MLSKVVPEEEPTDKKRALIQRNEFSRVLSHWEKNYISVPLLFFWNASIYKNKKPITLGKFFYMLNTDEQMDFSEI